MNLMILHGSDLLWGEQRTERAGQSLRPEEEVGTSKTGHPSPMGESPIRSKPNQRTGSESCVVRG